MLPRSSRSGLERFKRISREPFLPRGYAHVVLPPRVGGALRRRQSLHNLGFSRRHGADQTKIALALLTCLIV